MATYILLAAIMERRIRTTVLISEYTEKGRMYL